MIQRKNIMSKILVYIKLMLFFQTIPYQVKLLNRLK